MNVLTVVIVIAVVGYVVGRQLLGEPIRQKRLITLPAILTAVGLLDLVKGTDDVSGKDVVLIAVGAVIAGALGYVQGRTLHMEERNDGLWGRLPVRGLWLWAALYVSRGALIAIAVSINAKAASGVHAELFILGVNRLAQAVDVVLRARAAGIPLAPEPQRHGPRVTTLLDGLLGDTRTRDDASTPASPTRTERRAADPSPTDGDGDDRPSAACGGANDFSDRAILSRRAGRDERRRRRRR